jgi:hypothetical protein
VATWFELYEVWKNAGGWIITRDGREMPMKQLWEEQYDKNSKEWEEVFRDPPVKG